MGDEKKLPIFLITYHSSLIFKQKCTAVASAPGRARGGEKGREVFVGLPGGLAAVSVCVAADDEAGATEDGAALRWVERDGRLLSALRALDGDFDALPRARGLRGGDCRQSLVLGLLAGLAALRLVPQSLVVKE